MEDSLDIKEQTVLGTRWNIGVTGVRVLVQIISLTILARLLSPDDFGLMNMVMVVVGFGQLFADFGFTSAIIYQNEVSKIQLSTLYWINILIGFILFILTWLTIPLIILYYQEPALTPIIKWASSIFFIVPLGQLYDSMLRKELRFGVQARIRIVGQFLYLFTSITLAILGFGVMSLIWGTIANSLGTAILLIWTAIKYDWLPILTIKISEIKSLFEFGSYQVGDRLVAYLSNNIDYILIGRFLGTEALGFYNLAYSFIRLPTSLINPVIVSTLFPSFSKIKTDNKRIRRIYEKVLMYISIMVFPIMIGIALTAPLVIRLFYGEQWIPSIPVVQIFTLVAILRSLGNPMGALLLSKGKPDISFYINIGSLILMTIANFIGVNWGIWGVSISVLIVTIIKSPLTIYIPYVFTGFNMRNFWKAVRIPLFATLTMAIVYYSIAQIQSTKQLFTIYLLGIYSDLILLIPVSALIYFALLWILDKVMLKEIFNLLIPQKKTSDIQ